MAVGGETEMLGKIGTTTEAVHIVENPEARSSVGRDLDDADRLAGHRSPATLGQPRRQPKLARGQEQQPPSQARPGRRVAAHAGLAALVAEQVGHGLDHMRRRLADLVEGQERVAGPAGQGLGRVVRRPRLVRCTPHTELATCRIAVLPVDEAPKKWNPPLSSPTR